MPIFSCPNCNKGLDFEGFFGGALFYCECEKIYRTAQVFDLVEIPNEEVDLSDLSGKWPIPENRYCTARMSRGLFIRRDRWKKVKKDRVI